MRSTRKRTRAKRGMTDITLTPLIDTALTLLVIFMITAPMMRNSINIQLPQGQVKELQDDHPKLFIQINTKGELFFDGKPIDNRDKLIATIKAEAARTKITTVVIEGDERVDYGAVFGLVDQIKRVGGIHEVAMSSRRS